MFILAKYYEIFTVMRFESLCAACSNMGVNKPLVPINSKAKAKYLIHSLTNIYDCNLFLPAVIRFSMIFFRFFFCKNVPFLV